MLPFDYGTTPAADAGIPGLNLDNTFTSGLPAGDVDRNGDRGFIFGSSLDANRCNCPLEQDENQFQLVGNVTKLVSAATPSRLASTFGARTTCASRAMRIAPAS